MDGHRAGIPLGILVVLPSFLELPVGKAVGLVSEKAHLKLALIAGVADGLPSHLVGVLVFLDILRKGVESLFFDELNTWSQSGTIAMVRMGRYQLVYDKGAIVLTILVTMFAVGMGITDYCMQFV